MADYGRRLGRLEDRAAAIDGRDDALLEAVQNRTAELLASDEMMAAPLPDMPKEEWAAYWAAIQAAVKAAQGKR